MITTDNASNHPPNHPELPIKTLGAVIALALASCGGGGGSGYSAPVMSATPLVPTINLSISQSSITLGQSAVVTWTTMNAASCSASGSWSGTETTANMQTVTPTATGNNTYTLTCTAPSGGTYAGGGGGTSMMSVSLTVNAATAYVETDLVSFTAGTSARTVDPNLQNPWGLVFGPTTPAWVANNGTSTSTLYDGTGKPQPATPLIVTLAANFDPSGIVFNGTTDFMVTSGSNSAAALFIFTGEAGMIAGWAPSTGIVTEYTDKNGAVFKGMALANNGSGNFLYAADFHNNKVDVFDAKFAPQTTSATSFGFVDPNLPANYSPFNIQAVANGTNGATQLYVAFAIPAPPENHDNMNGAGLGLIDIFDTNGNFVKRLVSPGGQLNAPWGLALAPKDFGTLSNTLLVANFGDGKINGFDPSSGTFMGTVGDANGTPFAVPGLWGIAFGNDSQSQPHNTLFFTAGTNDEADGVYGRLDMGMAPTL